MLFIKLIAFLPLFLCSTHATPFTLLGTRIILTRIGLQIIHPFDLQLPALYRRHNRQLNSGVGVKAGVPIHRFQSYYIALKDVWVGVRLFTLHNKGSLECVNLISQHGSTALRCSITIRGSFTYIHTYEDTQKYC